MKLHSSIYGWEYVWEEFAEEKGGTVIRDDDSRDAHVAALHLPLPDSTSVISVSNESNGTTMVANYLPGQLEATFRLVPQNALLKLERAIGIIHNVTVGDAKFDRRFLLQSNEKMVGHIFDDAELRRLILEEQISEIKTVAHSAQANPLWKVPAEHSFIVCHQNQFLLRFEQLDQQYSIMRMLIEGLKTHGFSQKAEKEEQDQAPPAEVAVAQPRLHSPLLGR